MRDSREQSCIKEAGNSCSCSVWPRIGATRSVFPTSALGYSTTSQCGKKIIISCLLLQVRYIHGPPQFSQGTVHGRPGPPYLLHTHWDGPGLACHRCSSHTSLTQVRHSLPMACTTAVGDTRGLAQKPGYMCLTLSTFVCSSLHESTPILPVPPRYRHIRLSTTVFRTRSSKREMNYF